MVDEAIVSRSRFLCYVSPCNSPEQARAYIKSIQKMHPNANHHCYAFISGHPQDSQKYGFSDDGEPSGTAGRPMLSVLQGSDIGEVCAVVVRYFGGTKLGTGGLQRAYGGSVREALTKLAVKTKIPMVHKTLACQYTQVKDVLYLIGQLGGEIVEQDYAEVIKLLIALPASSIDNANEQIRTLSAGKLTLKSIDRDS